MEELQLEESDHSEEVAKPEEEVQPEIDETEVEEAKKPTTKIKRPPLFVPETQMDEYYEF